MVDLKKLRAELNLNQTELAAAMNCTQGFISHIELGKAVLPLEYENRLRGKYGDKLVDKCQSPKRPWKSSLFYDLLGWHDYTSPTFMAYQRQLLLLLASIQEKTGLDTEEIAVRVYGKKKTIGDALEKGIMAPHMARYIFKHQPKLGLQKDEVSLPPLEILPPPKDSVPYYRGDGYPDSVWLENLNEAERIIIPGSNGQDFYLKYREPNMAPFIQAGDIVGLKETGSTEIRLRNAYLLRFANGSWLMQYLNPGGDEEHWNISDEIGNNNGREIPKAQIERAYHVNTVIRQWD